MKANYRKLPNGTWGIWVHHDGTEPKPGSSIRVERRDGVKQTETVKEIVWRGAGGDVCMCSIEPQQRIVREEESDDDRDS